MKGLVVLLLFVLSVAYAKEMPFTIEDRDRLIRVEAKVDALDKRIDSLEKRMDSLERQMDRIVNIMLAIFGGQIALVAVSIGFAIWDRRTTIRPLEEKSKETDKRISLIEDRQERIIQVMKSLAKKDEELRALLEKHGIL